MPKKKGGDTFLGVVVEEKRKGGVVQFRRKGAIKHVFFYWSDKLCRQMRLVNGMQVSFALIKKGRRTLAVQVCKISLKHNF